ncbi:uncharacterized protein METZ01_LOCUS106258 [marine metagenome]|uniref:Uncharacterized protein n=1 Tax=marine metagenome TaxID=408172 RepID=A0A381WLP7_9ZZZZ
MKRESYWDFMGRKLRESMPMDTTLMYQREVFELQKTLQEALIRQKELVEQAYALKRKVALLGGEEKQLEMDF